MGLDAESLDITDRLRALRPSPGEPAISTERVVPVPAAREAEEPVPPATPAERPVWMQHRDEYEEAVRSGVEPPPDPPPSTPNGVASPLTPNGGVAAPTPAAAPAPARRRRTGATAKEVREILERLDDVGEGVADIGEALVLLAEYARAQAERGESAGIGCRYEPPRRGVGLLRRA